VPHRVAEPLAGHVLDEHGIARPGFPSAGAWVTYGLGTENRDLPGFVVFPPGTGKGGAVNWGSGFLPSSYQGTLLRTAAGGRS
jgi:hypothetical protein